MAELKERSLIYTEKEKCRRCYTCVRECPAKAIKIAGGQAEVISQRCIGCGNCVVVCSQNAKKYKSSIDQILFLLKSRRKTVAIVAPSFPAEFQDFPSWEILVGMLRALGFRLVSEVAFGADLVVGKYLQLMQEKTGSFISSSCPAVVSYIEKYQPELVPLLAPVVSPMVAAAMAMKKKYGDDLKIVFIGPCIAKKAEAEMDQFNGLIDGVLTFSELRELFIRCGIDYNKVKPSFFDPPLGGRGALFPLHRGLILSADLDKRPVGDEIVSAQGRVDFPEVLREFQAGFLTNHYLDLLCCQGCIMGPGMSKGSKRFVNWEAVNKYVQERKNCLSSRQHKIELEYFRDLDLSRCFQPDDKRVFSPTGEEVERVLQQMGKNKREDELDCGACGYDTCREHAVAVLTGLAEHEMCLPYTVEKLHQSVIELANTEKALKQSEKLASMGQLSAGIAHEVNNPLGVVLLYSHLLMERLEPDSQLFEDVKMIAEQADRCKKIISGLLNFARKNEVQLEETDINELIDAALQDVVVPEGISIRCQRGLTEHVADLDPGQIIQVLTNIIKNALDVSAPGEEIIISTAGNDREVSISVEDHGPGIPREHLDKLFDPFFTTKPIGKGTGLGLSVSYGIVKMHRGRILVVSNTDPGQGKTGTVFTTILPRYSNKD